MFAATEQMSDAFWVALFGAIGLIAVAFVNLMNTFLLSKLKNGQDKAAVKVAEVAVAAVQVADKVSVVAEKVEIVSAKAEIISTRAELVAIKAELVAAKAEIVAEKVDEVKAVLLAATNGAQGGGG